MIKIGQQAPEFKETAYVNGDFKEVSLSDYKGKWLVFFFYPLDFTFVCPTELRAFAQMHKKFTDAGAEVLACSTDSKFSHKAWYEKDLPEVKYPVLADFTKRVSRNYGVLNEDTGFANRGVFIISPEGKIEYAAVTATSVGRNTEEVYRILRATQEPNNCPVNWQPGEKTL
ncbi:MAG: peroxiredoxin [Bdellovibrionales bacterium]|nr:peroxiredoxin [Bdellovibrionales bacterium]